MRHWLFYSLFSLYLWQDIQLTRFLHNLYFEGEEVFHWRIDDGNERFLSGAHWLYDTEKIKLLPLKLIRLNQSQKVYCLIDRLVKAVDWNWVFILALFFNIFFRYRLCYIILFITPNIIRLIFNQFRCWGRSLKLYCYQPILR